VSPDAADDRTLAAVRRFLDDHATMTLACADGEGPWAADVYYVREGRVLYFFSSPDSRHSRAYARVSRAAATVHGTYEGWEDIRGVQMSGEVREVSSAPEKAKAVAAYLGKFAFVGAFLTGAGRAAREKVRFYRLTPHRVLWVDNAKGFGNREEVAW
jgi:uncharacterized protein YhbP (UPF0306 family)